MPADPGYSFAKLGVVGPCLPFRVRKNIRPKPNAVRVGNEENSLKPGYTGWGDFSTCKGTIFRLRRRSPVDGDWKFFPRLWQAVEHRRRLGGVL